MPLNLGAALGGYQGQGGLVPQLQAQDAQRQKQQQMALIYQAMQGAPPQGTPQQSSQPAPQPSAPASPSPVGPGMPQGAPSIPSTQMQGLPQQVNGPQQVSSQPPVDPLTQFTAKLAQSKAPDWMKGEALQQFMAAYAPLMAQQREQAREKELERHDQAMELIGNTNAGAHKESADAAATNAGTNVVKANKPPKETSLAQDPQYKALENDASMWKQRVVNPAIQGKDHDDAMKKYTAANQALATYKAKKASTEATAAGKVTGGDAPLITSKEDYDKLPSGATYKEDDGVTYTKP